MMSRGMSLAFLFCRREIAVAKSYGSFGRRMHVLPVLAFSI
jgi:hypothetical protein